MIVELKGTFWIWFVGRDKPEKIVIQHPVFDHLGHPIYLVGEGVDNIFPWTNIIRIQRSRS